jgi:hypothetical protein
MAKSLDIDNMIDKLLSVVRPGLHMSVTETDMPHYCGEFDNATAVMSVSDQLLCSFQVFKPTTKAVAYKDISVGQLTIYGAVPS